jgi:hypothetical protein
MILVGGDEFLKKIKVHVDILFLKVGFWISLKIGFWMFS